MPSLTNSLQQQVKQVVILSTQVNIRLPGTNGIGGDGYPLNEGEGVVFQNIAVLKCPHFTFISITDNIFLIPGGLSGHLPFYPTGEPGPTPSPQV